MMNPTHLLDTHCHIGAYRDPVAVIRAAEANTSIVAVTESPEEYRRLRTRLGRRDHIQVALGLHPLKAHTFTPNDLARFFRLLPEATWIGEVGLDFSRQGVATAKHQLRIFDAVLTEAQPGRHPLTVHSRGAEADTIGFLAQARLPAVLHWYTGPTGPIDAALDAGLYFSYNVAMVRSKKFAALLRAIPRNRTLLETDGPYARAEHGPAQPHQIDEVVIALAGGWGISHSEATRAILENQRQFITNAAKTPPGEQRDIPS
jgi:TatD DNase family protein